MKIIDVTVPLSEDLPVWPGDPRVRVEPVKRIAKGDSSNVSLLTLSDHTGTHVDPPLHFLPGGATVDQLDLNVLYGPARVVDMTSVGKAITVQDLEKAKLPASLERILFKTSNSGLWGRNEFETNYVHLSTEAAQWLVARGIRLIGVDYLSVEEFKPAQPNTHRALLGAGVIILEGLNLSQVAPGDYTLACLPLKIRGGDGAPCRTILIQE